MIYRKLRSAAVVIAAILCIFDPGSSLASDPAHANDSALAFVQAANMGAGLESLALEVAHRTATYAMLVEKRSASGADALVKKELTALLPKYRPQWDRTLANVYAHHFTSGELRSLAELRSASPYVAKFNSTHQAVANDMKDAASPLLQELVTEALTRASIH